MILTDQQLNKKGRQWKEELKKKMELVKEPRNQLKMMGGKTAFQITPRKGLTTKWIKERTEYLSLRHCWEFQDI